MSKRTYSSSDKLILFLATGFCAGHAPKAPGTVGTIVAIAPLLLLQQLTLVPYILVVAFAPVLPGFICAIKQMNCCIRMITKALSGMSSVVYGLPLSLSRLAG